MRYEGVVYRPPSEARSLIIQLTIGCARNTCTFCTMFKDKKFRIRPIDDVIEDLEVARVHYKYVRRVFLADGDALIVKTQDLLVIIDKIHQLFPECERISVYGAPKDILVKTDDELKVLKEAGLDMIYMGAESGDEQVLTDVCKGVTSEEIIQAGIKARKAGILLSVTYISGLGGRARFREHAMECARAITRMKPEYVGFLTLMVEAGTPMCEQVTSGEMELLGPEEVLEEMKLVIENIDSEGTVFRSNHASNYVPLAGTFNQDKAHLLKQIREAQSSRSFRPEGFRGI